MTELQKLEQQVAELQATIERMKNPEFTYPMWFVLKANTLSKDIIVKFISETTGIDSRGIVYNNYVSCLDTSVWTQVPEPIKQWEPQGGEWHLSGCGEVIEFNRMNLDYTSFGHNYPTKEQAEWARDQMRRFNRLLAYVAEHDVDENGVQWMPDWEDITQEKCTTEYNHKLKKWSYNVCFIRQDLTVVMSKQCAKNLFDKLNSGEVVL
jgi:hypothetical protein